MVTALDFTQGLFSLIFVILNITIGLRIVSRYIEFKRTELLLVGIAWMGLANPWLPDTLNFILLLTNSPFLDDYTYFIIGNAFLPIFITLWLISFSRLLKFEKRKLILGITVILSIAFEIAFFIMLSIDTALIGESLGPFHYEFSIFIMIYLLLCIFTILITGLMFARESLKVDNPEIKLKGKLLIVAFIAFVFGALLDSMPILTATTVVLTRVILMISAVFFYMGFILPEWTKKIFLK